MQRTPCRTLVMLGLVALPGIAHAQGSGTVTGRVTDRSTNQPIPDAQVVIVGTQRATRTNDNGQYRLVSVPAGRARVRVLRLGYEAQVDSVTVTAGQETTADFTLAQTATQLDQVIVSATGESQLRRETGNAVATIAADSIPKTVVAGVTELLSSRAANVTVTQTSGTTGGGSRIRIRGSNSISLSNEPLVIIDGIRAASDPGGSTIDIGGQNPTRLDDLNPEDIESIEIIKGPAAAALYGTAAANGVIQISTKRGRAGRTRWSVYADGGTVRDITDYPANYAQVGRTGSGARTTNCQLQFQALGLCTPVADSILSFNPLEDAPVQIDGWRTKFGVSASGGTDVLQYYLGADLDREQGVYTNNSVSNKGFRANLTGQLGSQVDFGVRAGYNQVRLRLPQNDNNDLSPIANGIFGRAQRTEATQGYLFYSPDVLNAVFTDQHVDRLTGAVNGGWRPRSWLNVVGTTGIDFASRRDAQVLGPDLIPEPDRRALGNRTSNPYSFWTYTANLGATATFYPSPSLESQTSLGTQYNQESVSGTQAFGEGLAAGTESLAGTTSGFAVAEQNTEIVTLGAYVQQKLAWRDRLFVSASVRGDDNSNFGDNFDLVTYPAASISWVTSDESWFPQSTILSNLRLRGAVGQSGQRPGFRNAITFYNAVGVKRAGSDVGGVEISANVGNADLKPELSTEHEAGIDLGFLDDRLSLELTYYDKTTKDALIQRSLAPSSGAATRFENLGKVTNKGFEASLNATVLDLRNVKWNVMVQGSTNRNELVRLGQDVDTIFFGLGANDGNFIQRFVEGHPIGGYWQRPFLGYQDKDNDGILNPFDCGPTQAESGPDCEVFLGDNVAFLGNPLPKHEVSINTGLTLFRYARLTALLNYRGGHTLYNSTEQFRCAVLVRCRAAFDKTAPIEEQARVMASLLGSDAGYVEDASFWKLREVALTLSAPNDWARRVRTQSLSLTLAGRNLATWTDYTGFDPEVNWNGTSNFSTADFLTQPLVRYWTARLSFSW